MYHIYSVCKKSQCYANVLDKPIHLTDQNHVNDLFSVDFALATRAKFLACTVRLLHLCVISAQD